MSHRPPDEFRVHSLCYSRNVGASRRKLKSTKFSLPAVAQVPGRMASGVDGEQEEGCLPPGAGGEGGEGGEGTSGRRDLERVKADNG